MKMVVTFLEENNETISESARGRAAREKVFDEHARIGISVAMPTPVFEV